jgi:Na+-driven multidrug efflux pump
MAAGWGTFVWLLSLAVGRPVAAIFNDDPAVFATELAYMAIVFPSYGFLGALVTTLNTLNALHRAVLSMLLSAVRVFVLYVPLAYLGSWLIGLNGVWWAAFTGNTATGIIAVLWFRRLFRRMEAEPPPVSWEAESEYEAISV